MLLPSTNIRFNYVTNSKVQDITSKDSKFFHINLLECKKLQFQHVTITAPTDSPNTDGIHVGRSSQITITNADIGTGDDCISIGDGTQDITVNQVTCRPGHGISIGSLGRYQNEEPISGIRVTGATLSNTDNGVRIKTWPASPSRVASDIHFEDVVMNNIANPININQNYCPNSQCSNQSPSKVKISNVSFKKIRGISSTKEAVNLICSKRVPCQQVVLLTLISRTREVEDLLLLLVLTSSLQFQASRTLLLVPINVNEMLPKLLKLI
nr:polygalacturonase [Quercus suber]